MILQLVELIRHLMFIHPAIRNNYAPTVDFAHIAADRISLNRIMCRGTRHPSPGMGLILQHPLERISPPPQIFLLPIVKESV